jgi:CRISPR/Cas system type I-B associated protein Csh2 (Cas7 group RAMP superfamily)
MKTLALLISALTISACTWVNENADGRTVNVSTSQRISNCQKKGDINVSVASKIGFINRSSKKIHEELLVLARNEAIKLRADTIVPESEPTKGTQKYLAYSCVN